MRDSERQRTYDAEAAALGGAVSTLPVGVERCRELFAEVRRSDLWQVEAAGCDVQILAARRDARRSSAAGSRVRLVRSDASPLTLAHELAHVAAGPADPGHGPRFRALEVALVRLLCGTAAAAALDAAFDARRLRVDDLPVDGAEAGADGITGGGTVQCGDGRLAHAVRVRKLLNKASSTDSPAEAAALMAKAAELAARHQVDELVLARLDGATVDDIVERKVHLGAGPYVGARIDLLAAVARNHSCEVFWVSGDTWVQATVAGYRRDVAEVLGLHSRLAAHAAVAVLAEKPEGNTLRWRRAFLLGYAAKVDRLLAESLARAVADADASAPEGTASVALELAGRADTVLRHLKDAYPFMRTVSHGSSRVDAAKEAGARAAAAAPLSRRGGLPDGRSAAAQRERAHPLPPAGDACGQRCEDNQQSR